MGVLGGGLLASLAQEWRTHWGLVVLRVKALCEQGITSNGKKFATYVTSFITAKCPLRPILRAVMGAWRQFIPPLPYPYDGG